MSDSSSSGDHRTRGRGRAFLKSRQKSPETRPGTTNEFPLSINQHRPENNETIKSTDSKHTSSNLKKQLSETSPEPKPGPGLRRPKAETQAKISELLNKEIQSLAVDVTGNSQFEDSKLSTDNSRNSLASPTTTNSCNSADPLEIPASPTSANSFLGSSTTLTELHTDSQQRKKLSPYAPIFVPRWLKSMDLLDTSILTSPSTGPDSAILNYVKDTILKLTSSPGLYDEYMKTLVANLNVNVTDDSTILQVITYIFIQSVNEPNFRYTGARMCEYLSENVTVVLKTGNFRQNLLRRFQSEYKQRAKLAADPGLSKLLHGFSMFLGELFMHMKITGKDGKLQRMQILGVGLKELILTLMEHPTDDNMKCAVNILKFTGAVLDDSEVHSQTQITVTMDSIIEKLKNVLAEAEIDKNTRKIIMNVIEFRASDWGRSVSSPIVRSHSPILPGSVQPFTQTEPVFYDAQGRQITRDQAGYGSEQGALFNDSAVLEDYEYDSSLLEPWSNIDSSVDNYVNDADDHDFDDDEIQAAFEQFILENDS